MIDLHCHLLPGVDDGAVNDDQSIELFKLAIADGITHMVLTPHVHPGRYENNSSNLQAPFCRLKALLAEHKLEINISVAGEVRLCSEVLNMYATNELPYIGKLCGKNVMLLEFPHEGIPPGSDKLVDWLLQRDILPMIAHPERNKTIMRDINKAAPYIERGCLFQLTAMSVTGKFGEAAHKVAHQFLSNDWATIIASDAHNIKHRPPVLSEAYKCIEAEYSADLAKELFLDTPAKIIQLQ
ncbi:MAG: hypothetical protein OFPI_00580 [Osedax symbiont Rs2]|nr:MAG: hypothetical protein OFPI_00580 [Osedax symbiont Rs2]